jgi:hypothetical protein
MAPVPWAGAYCCQKDTKIMIALMMIPVLGAVGYSLIYLLLGGGLGGAVLIFFVAKLFGK